MSAAAVSTQATIALCHRHVMSRAHDNRYVRDITEEDSQHVLHGSKVTRRQAAQVADTCCLQ